MMKNNQKSAQINDSRRWAQEVLSAEITYDFDLLEIMTKKISRKNNWKRRSTTLGSILEVIFFLSTSWSNEFRGTQRE